MANFGGMNLTDKGRALQAKAQTGVELKYTRMAIGDGQLAGQQIPKLDKLISEKMSLKIAKLQVQPGGKAVIGSSFSNKDVTNGFYFRELGVFAQDPDAGEILYCYGNTGQNAEFIPPGGSGSAEAIEKAIDIITIVGNAPNVTAVIDSSMVYVSKSDMDTALEKYLLKSGGEVGPIKVKGGAKQLTIAEEDGREAWHFETYVGSPLRIVQTGVADRVQIMPLGKGGIQIDGREVATQEWVAENATSQILPAKAFTAEDSGDAYPKGVSMFYLDADGMQSGWPFNNGQVLTFVTGKNRVSQMVFETNIATQRIWTRRWSSSQKAWSEFLQIETTAGSAEKVVQALEEAKAYTDEKTATIDAPVKSVNSKTGDVVLTSDDVGAAPKEHTHDASAINSGTIAAARLPSATTGAKGIVQLSDSLYSTSTQQAATANAVKQVYDEMMLVKQSVVDGKGKVAGAINDMGGGPVSANNTFDELAAAIRANQGASGDTGYTKDFLMRFGQSGVDDKISGKFWFNKDGNAVGLIKPSYDSYQTYNVELIEVSVAGTIVSKKTLDTVYSTRGFNGGFGIVTPDLVVYMCLPGKYEANRLRIRNHAGTILVDSQINDDAINKYTRIIDATTINGQYRFSALVEYDTINGTKKFNLGIIDQNLNELFRGSGAGTYDDFTIGGRGKFIDRNTAIAYVGGGHQMIRWNGSVFTEVYGGWLTIGTHENILSAFAYRD